MWFVIRLYYKKIQCSGNMSFAPTAVLLGVKSCLAKDGVLIRTSLIITITVTITVTMIAGEVLGPYKLTTPQPKSSQPYESNSEPPVLPSSEDSTQEVRRAETGPRRRGIQGRNLLQLAQHGVGENLMPGVRMTGVIRKERC